MCREPAAGGQAEAHQRAGTARVRAPLLKNLAALITLPPPSSGAQHSQGLPAHVAINRVLYRGLDAYNFRPDFMAFCHRGHAIPLAVEGTGSASSSKASGRLKAL